MASAAPSHTGVSSKISITQWNAHKSLLKQKYIDEDWSLRRVRDYMLKEHGFNASSGQYQRVFNKWQFRKNSRRQDCENALALLREKRLDIDQVELREGSNATRAKYQRALHRYHRPLLLFHPAIGAWSRNQGSDRSQTLKLQFNNIPSSLRSVTSTTDLSQARAIRMRPRVITRLRTPEALPLECFMRLTQDFASMQIDSFSDRINENSAMFLPLILQKTAAGKNFQNVTQDLRHVLAPGLCEGFHGSVASIVYQISNGKLEFNDIATFIESVAENGAMHLIRPIFESKLETAKAFSETVLRALFATLFKSSYEHKRMRDFESVLCHILKSEINVNASVADYDILDGVDRRLTLLQLVLFRGRIDLAFRLLQAGADINLCDEHGKMTSEAKGSCCEYLPVLLFCQQDFNSNANNTNFAKMWNKISEYGPICCKEICLAAATPYHDILQMLLIQGVDPDNARYPPLLLSMAYRESQSVAPVKWLTGLQKAAYESDLKAASLLIKAGADPSGRSLSCPFSFLRDRRYTLRTACGMTPLSIACFNGDQAMIRLLLHHGASVDACSRDIQLEKEQERQQCYKCHSARLRLDCHNCISTHIWRARKLLDAVSAPKYILEPIAQQRLCGLDLAAEIGCAPLQIAVAVSNHELVKMLLDNGAHVEGCHGLTPLAIAVHNSDRSLISELLAHGANPHGTSLHEPYITAFMVAAFLNDIETMRLLLSAAEKSFSLWHKTQEPFVWLAALTGSSDKALALLVEIEEKTQPANYCDQKLMVLERAMDDTKDETAQKLFELWLPHASQTQLQSLLQKCVRKNRNSLIRHLLTTGALADDPLVFSTMFSTMFPNMNSFGDERSVLISILLEKQFGVSSRTILHAIGWALEVSMELCWPTIHIVLSHWLQMPSSHSGTDVFQALAGLLQTTRKDFKDRCDAALLILRRGPYSEHRIHRCYATPLQKAARGRSFTLVKALVEAGADINAFTAKADPRKWTFETTRTALQHAVENDDKHMVEYLLAHGADVNAAGNLKGVSTALQLAAANSDIEMVQLLINADADVNSPGVMYHGRTALQCAAERGDIRILKLLLSEGANVNGVESAVFGRTALQLAAQVGNSNMVEFLLGEGADVNWPPAPHGGVTALQAAAIGGHLDVCQILITAGADVAADASKLEGRTAIEGAAEIGRLDVLKWLLDLWVEQSVGQGAEDDLAFQQTIQSAKHYADANCRWSIVSFLDDYQRKAASKYRASKNLSAGRKTGSSENSVTEELQQDSVALPESLRVTSASNQISQIDRAWSPDLAPFLRSPAPSEHLWHEE